MRRSLRIGIRGRLLWAFAAVAAATIAATVVGWISFTRLADTLDLVVAENVPAVTSAAQLAERGGGVIGAAPALAAAASEVERERIWQGLSHRLRDMTTIVAAMEQAVSGRAVLEEFATLNGALAANLLRLNGLVRERLERTMRKEELIERLRWSSADFLDEVEPMIDDTRFNISLALRQSSSAVAQATLSRELDKQRALFKINAEGSLLSELITRAANLPSRQDLEGTISYFNEIEERLNTDLQQITAVPGALSLRQSIRDIITFANGRDGIFQLRRQELNDVAAESDLLVRNQELLEHLHTLITRLVEQENTAALQAADQSRTTSRQGKFWLLLAVIISLSIAVPFVWLYVGRGLVGRIRTLDASMKTIADGDLDARVPVSGEDEIGDMANSLRTFRDTLAETQAELLQAAKLAALGQLTAGISHEINQPLSAIRHYARNTSLLLEKGRLDEARDNTAKITELLDKTNRIIKGLRSLSRKPQRQLRPTDMAKVLGDVMTVLEGRLRERHIQVETYIAEDARWVMAGEVRLEQVVLNLINNAIDAMQDAVVPRLIISTRRNDGWVELRVRDSGHGMSADVVEHIFDPFFTTKEVGEGLGLGLSVSYNIIRDFGGTLRVENHDQGAVFLLRLKPGEKGEMG